jgi:hypothetical protein
MPEMSKYYGLCENCEHDATCMLRRSSQLKIIQCEEFSVQSGMRKANGSSDGQTMVDPAEASRMGLCVNCLNATTCGFPNARQGVLQCEEYILDEAGVIPPVQSERSKSAA